MKNYFSCFINLLLLNLALCSVMFISEANAQSSSEVTFQNFYNDLEPYGQWVQDEQYGYVWVPDAEDDFRPYLTNGYWVMTEYGNTWVSGYPWGWAPFHYGRWIYNGYYGWIWVPGYEWAPAWVSWRYGGGYYGWAPLGPWFSVTVTIGTYNCPNDWWVFIPQRHLHHRRHYTYHPRNNIFIQNTIIINNTHVDNRTRTTYYYGPRGEDIRRATGRNVRVYKFEDSREPRTTRRSNTLEVYRPDIQKGDNGRTQAAPRNVIRSKMPIGDPQPLLNNERPAYRLERHPSRTDGIYNVRPAERVPDRREDKPQVKPQQPSEPQAPRWEFPRPDRSRDQAPRQDAPQRIPRQNTPQSAPREVRPEQAAPRQREVIPNRTIQKREPRNVPQAPADKPSRSR